MGEKQTDDASHVIHKPRPSTTGDSNDTSMSASAHATAQAQTSAPLSVARSLPNTRHNTAVRSTLVHEMQQTYGNRATRRYLQRTPNPQPPVIQRRLDPPDLVREHVSYSPFIGYTIDEEGIARALSNQLPADPDYVERVLDAVSFEDRDDVTHELADMLSDEKLTSMASSASGRAFLNRLTRELDAGYTSGGEQEQVERINRFISGVSSTDQAQDADSEAVQYGAAGAGPVGTRRLSFDALLEQMAHVMAYDKELSPEQQTLLDQYGYRAGSISTGRYGFQMRLFIPTSPDYPHPVVAFRGSEDPQDFSDDVNAIGVGRGQFSANRVMIEQNLAYAASKGKAIVTGHSLGGALAQIAGTEWPGSINRIVTFQSPGINAGRAASLHEHNLAAREGGEDAIRSTHYRVGGDVVPLAGSAFTPGDIHTFDLGLTFNPLDAHQALPLADQAAGTGPLPDAAKNTGHEIAGREDTTTDENNAEVRASEWLRRTIGVLSITPQIIASTVDDSSQDFLINNMISQAVERGDSFEEIAQWIESTGLDEERKAEARTKLIMFFPDQDPRLAE